MLKWLVNLIIRMIARILLKIDAKELQKVPMQGPLLAVANHVNFLDAPVVIAFLHPRPTTGLVKKESWDNPLHAFLFNIWGGIPIDREIADFAAFRAAKAAIKEGKILAVAPEGTRSEDGRMVRGKPGIAMLAKQCDVPIMPFAYFGHENFVDNLKKFKRTPMHIRVGKLFKINWEGKSRDKETLQEVTDAIMLEVADLLPEEYRGAYSEISVDRTAYIEPLS
jgi:1-acyl-sn-glycerol-3-phosphate acyltransferase